MREPKHTCPDIDRVIRALKASIKDVEHAKSLVQDAFNLTEVLAIENLLNNAMDILDQVVYDINLVDEMEELRGANSQLRDWGHYLDNELEKALNQ